MHREREMEIQQITDDGDKKRIIELCDGVFPHSLVHQEAYPEILHKICDYAEFFAAFQGTAPVGYAAVYANDSRTRTAYITMIGVLEECQRSGVGSLLMESCVRIAREKGMDAVRLEVLNINQKAISFYKKCGFVEEGPCSDVSTYLRKQL